MTRRSRKSLFYWLVLSPLMLVILLPYAVMVSTALKPSSEVFLFPPTWIPSRIQLSNFSDMWQSTDFGRAFLNSLYVSLVSTVLTIIIAIPAAYATARFEFRGKGLFRQFLLLTQMLSPVVLIIGIFRLMGALGLVNALNSLVLAYAGFNTAFAVWMLQSYFRSIPAEIEEAAWMDGASRFASLRLVFLPLALPAIGVTAIFTFVNSWTDFILAFTLLRSPEKLTATIKVFLMVSGAYHVDWNYVMAATLVATVPVAIIFAVLQRYMVRGLALGAVK